MISLNVQPAESVHPRHTPVPIGFPPESSTGQVLEIVNIFRTVQGEGPFAGRPAIFVRLAGCNLQCPLCFGIATPSRIPYLYTANGPKIRLDRVRTGQRLLTFDQDAKLVETEVTGFVSRVVDEWVEVRIANKTYDVTPEHPFFTMHGLVTAAELVVGDDVLEVKSSEIIAYKKLDDKNPMRRPEVNKKKVRNTDYKAVAKKISKTRLEKFATGELRASFYSLTPEQQETCRRKQSEAKRRENNPNWKGICPNLLDVQDGIDNGTYTKCERCDCSGKRLLVHHKDGNHDNDTRENLAVWCHQCHNQHHERGYNFWNGSRTDGKELVKKHNGQRVESVEKKKGVLRVVNVSCAPYNTYLANGMWVHNCDTDYTTNRHWASVQGIVNTVDLLNAHGSISLVVITGGEPLRQPLGPLVRLLAERHKVQIETNGTIYERTLGEETSLGDYVLVCSPKTGISFHLSPDIKYYKYVLRAGFVDTDDGLPTRSLDSNARPGRPPLTFSGTVYISPCDEGDAERNKLNTAAAIESCLRYGYTLCVQLHKVVGLP